MCNISTADIILHAYFMQVTLIWLILGFWFQLEILNWSFRKYY